MNDGQNLGGSYVERQRSYVIAGRAAVVCNCRASSSRVRCVRYR